MSSFRKALLLGGSQIPTNFAANFAAGAEAMRELKRQEAVERAREKMRTGEQLGHHLVIEDGDEVRDEKIPQEGIICNVVLLGDGGGGSCH